MINNNGRDCKHIMPRATCNLFTHLGITHYYTLDLLINLQTWLLTHLVDSSFTFAFLRPGG